jgi:hypothetical protein
MERLINSDSRVTQLCSSITLRNLEDGGDIFSETSVQTSATRYEVPKGIYKYTYVLAELSTIICKSTQSKHS